MTHDPMLQSLVEMSLAAVGLYLVVGLVVGLGFVFLGTRRVDAAARGAGLGFRLIILPAAAALWPIMLIRWISVRAPVEDETGGTS